MNKKLTALLLLLTGFLSAQNTGSLSGRILDAQSQLPLEGATVILIGTSLGVVTNQDGYFTIEDIPTQSL